ncbi:acyl-CoA thioesterase [Noviherbaspirillum sp. ST9]|uniref:acyl-CoA thioesterase n=1 Tax=Noviherbaspirillum sp. ST9 TaxID=3401606 RepID=UPI003B5881FB
MEQIEYQYQYTVSWSDLDANVHLRNTSYLDYAAQTRFLYMKDNGFTPADFKAAGMGPIVFSEQIVYHKELHFLENFSVTMELGGISEDGAKFIMVNRFRKADGRLAAEVITRGAWFDLAARRVKAPPQALTDVLLRLPRTNGFESL